MIPPILPENVLGLHPDAIAVTNDPQPWFDLFKEGQRSPKVATVAEQRHGFAHDVPGGAKRRPGRGGCDGQRPCARMVHILGIEAGVKE